MQIGISVISASFNVVPIGKNLEPARSSENGVEQDPSLSLNPLTIDALGQLCKTVGILEARCDRAPSA
jgi:hypothetical protein